MGMTYNQWNDVVRNVVNKHTRIVPGLKLPNTVMLDFRRGKSKQLSIKTFSRLFEGLGLTVEFVIKDKNGNEIGATEFEQIVKDKFGNVNKQTLATIAGVSSANKKTKNAAQNPNLSSDNDMPDVDSIIGNNDSKSNTAENSDQQLSASPEMIIDLSDIFESKDRN